MTLRIAALETQLLRVESRLQAAQRRGRNAWIASGIILLSAVMLAANPQVQAQFGVTLASLNTRLIAVETKTAPLSYNSGTKLLTVSGANVMIVDGTVATESTSGLGNFQVGYNELSGFGDNRTGTHNLIVGSRNNYSSYGGMVVGDSNSIVAKYAVVSGGFENTASGSYASVSGGRANISSFDSSSVSGGVLNTANGEYSSISGGGRNLANGIRSSVSGGFFNLASGAYASVSGGEFNTADGGFTSILGGNSINLNTNLETYPAGP